MGQYYHQIIETFDSKGNLIKKVFRTQTESWFKNQSADHYNGLKLMEHSWWYNDFCNQFAHQLVDKPTRVAWVGDYTEEDELEKIGVSYSEIWDLNDSDYEYTKETNFNMDSVKYLVNNDKKIYIDLQKYKEESNNGNWCIFPISLLTAIGCGRGSGDYHKENDNFDIVGSWTWDRIYLTNDKPSDDFEEEDIYFKED